MNRREALSSVALLLGGTIIGAEAFLSGCTSSDKKIGAAGLNFSNDDIAFLDEVGETIIPATTTPGAKEAKIGQFMKNHPTAAMEFATGYKVAPEEYGYARYALRKEDVDLNHAVSRALDEIRADGTLSKIIA